jgi:hypothetical protein
VQKDGLGFTAKGSHPRHCRPMGGVLSGLRQRQVTYRQTASFPKYGVIAIHRPSKRLRLICLKGSVGIPL